MRIRGYMLPRSNYCYIDATLVSHKLSKPERLKLLIDTGADTTTILDGDCARLGLNSVGLLSNKKPTMVVGGVIGTHVLVNAQLLLKDTLGKLHPEPLKSIDVVYPTRRGALFNFSLLGVDILGRYNRFVVNYGRREVFLER